MNFHFESIWPIEEEENIEKGPLTVEIPQDCPNLFLREKKWEHI